ncbi:hypothetical protein B0O80DRAFT_532385 [Mortierella sp. GBAus27b]|nr:hypothetical protein BGX31_005377 [Mortierella sp. GBA43]KAI8348332.1 hypothetical protein B0O80DRAFT_532385 [Mortierella sp. GBAus27b]
MSKRPLKESEGERRKSKRLTPDNVENTMVFGARPTCLEKCAVQYLADMRLHPQPNIEGFIAHIQSTHPKNKDRSGVHWNKLKKFFSSTDATSFSDIEDMANIHAFVEAFQAENYMQNGKLSQSEPGTEPAPAPASDPSTPSVPQPSPPALAIPDSSTTSTRSRASRSRSTSSGSDSTLSAGAVVRMKTEYDQNYADFKEEAWTLPSGACVDEIVAKYVRSLNKESSLHSFVIDNPAIILDLFADPGDKAVLENVLVKREGERPKMTNAQEEIYLSLYNKGPAEVKELLSNGWRNLGESEVLVPEVFRESIHLALLLIHAVYQNNQFKLPDDTSESFFLQTVWGVINYLFLCDDTLKFRPAEVHSHASSLRKNKDRESEDTAKQAAGRKVDGLISSNSTLLELCVIEAVQKDAGPNSIKALSDTRKLAKVLKDTFDAICARANTDIRSLLTVYGIRISGPSITYYSFRKRRGRFYQMAIDGTAAFPPQWNEKTTITMLTVIASIMAFRRRISEMAENVTGWTTQSFELLDPWNRPSMPSTLTTPPGSPRLAPRQSHLPENMVF